MKTKERIREEIKRKLETQGESERLARSDKIQAALFQTEEFRRANSILIYLAFKGEVGTEGIIRKCFSLNKRVVLPKVNRERDSLELREIRDLDQSLGEGAFGIREPLRDKTPQVSTQDIDMVVLPGLAFDSAGHRLGRGRGFYDRLLRQIPEEIPRIALAFSFQIMEIPVESHDQPVTQVLSA